MSLCRNCHQRPPLGKSVVYFMPHCHIRVCHPCYDDKLLSFVQLGGRVNWLKRIISREVCRSRPST